MAAPAPDPVPAGEPREWTDEKARRILALIRDTPPRLEPLHERDCPACDIADQIAGELAAVWDPHENWWETEVNDGLPGDTMIVQVSRIAAHTLHRRMPGHQGGRRG